MKQLNTLKTRNFLLIFICLLASPIPGDDDSSFCVSKVDAAIQKGQRIYLFRYAPWSAQLWPADNLKAWPKNKGKTPVWKPIARPQGAFMPVQVLNGQSFNFLVLEGSQRRIWQLDSALQILSSMELPAAIKERAPGAFRLFWTRDHRFTFINVSEGAGIQYHESGGKLRFFRAFKLPLSCTDVYLADWHSGPLNSRHYPFICPAANSFKVFNSFFSEAKTVPLANLNKPDSSRQKAHEVSRPFLVLNTQRQPVLKFIVEGFNFYFNRDAGLFYYNPEN